MVLLQKLYEQLVRGCQLGSAELGLQPSSEGPHWDQCKGHKSERLVPQGPGLELMVLVRDTLYALPEGGGGGCESAVMRMA